MIATGDDLMAWNVTLTEGFAEWFRGESDKVRGKIEGSILLLEALGPNLGRPHADTPKGSLIANLKELWVQAIGTPYRLLFAFDPARQAVILCGSDKTNDKRFHGRMIPIAEAAYAEHLRSMKGNKP